jgi:hypothetical protein
MNLYKAVQGCSTELLVLTSKRTIVHNSLTSLGKTK